MRHEPEHALQGYDGRVVYASRLALNAYARLTPSMRDEVRAMVENEWQGALELKRDDMVDLDIVGGEFRISDCVASCRLDFGGTEERPRVVIDRQQAMVDGHMPDTLLLGLRRRDLADVVGNEVCRGLTINDAANEDGHTVLRHHSDSGFIVDAMGRPFETREKEKRA